MPLSYSRQQAYAQMLVDMHVRHAAYSLGAVIRDMANREGAQLAPFRVLWTTMARTNLATYDEQCARAISWASR